MKKIKEWIEEAKRQKRVHSDDLDRIISRCLTKYGYLFPDYICTKNGSKSVHHFHVHGVRPISLERVHGNREFVPRQYAKLVLVGIEELVAYIDMHLKDESYDDDDLEREEKEPGGSSQPKEAPGPPSKRRRS